MEMVEILIKIGDDRPTAQRCAQRFSTEMVVKLVATDGTRFCVEKRTDNRRAGNDGDPQKHHGNNLIMHMLVQNWRLVCPCLASFIFDSYLATAIFCSASRCISETCCFLTSLCVYSISFLFICLNLLTENKDIIVVDPGSICSRRLFSLLVSTRCFLRKHPHGQNVKYPQWMFECSEWKKYHLYII